ncbi:MAG: hypothetical protein BWK76_27880 [Desulfobulbaceae bacterium A2]|nr:MAG: hypothetical protein BWK76_27880 [Desulfobulbaceae bacterium A2]
MRSRPAPPLWAVHGLLLLAAVLVATSFLVGEAVADQLDPAVLTLVRFVIAAGLFFPWLCWHQLLARPSATDLARYAAISAALVLFFWLMFLSLRFTTALNTGVIFTLTPGISGLYSAVLLRERLGLHRLVALVLATAGALWVVLEGDPLRLARLDFNHGDLLFLLGCLAMAFYTPLVKLLYRGEHMATMTFWILVTGAAWLLLFAGFRLAAVPWPGVGWWVWGAVLYLAVFCTIITFFLTQYATLRLGPTRVMAYSFLYPPLVLLLAWGLGQPLPSWFTLAGMVLIVPAMFVIQAGAEPLPPPA